MVKLIKANILNPQSDLRCDYYQDGALLIDKGKILACGNYKDVTKSSNTLNLNLQEAELEHINFSDKLILPCFADLHFHWVQKDVCLAPKTDLMHWLSSYTWPAESEFADTAYSELKAKQFFQTLSQSGTTMGAIYSSIHEHTIDHVFENVHGDFIAGAVMMNRNSPDYLLESQQDSFKKNRRLAQKYGPRYAVSPRFIPSCTEASLREAAKIAEEYGCWIQTHLAETRDKEESAWQTLESTGLLTSKTILGHCLHLDDKGYETIAANASKIAHCPSSNAPIMELGLGSGLLNFEKVESFGIDWALASDIGAGPYLCMLDVMKSFYEQNQKAGSKKATAVKALYRATLKGAEILGLSHKKGNLNVGKDAEFVVINYKTEVNEAEKLLGEILKIPRKVLNDPGFSTLQCISK